MFTMSQGRFHLAKWVPPQSRQEGSGSSPPTQRQGGAEVAVAARKATICMTHGPRA